MRRMLRQAASEEKKESNVNVSAKKRGGGQAVVRNIETQQSTLSIQQPTIIFSFRKREEKIFPRVGDFYNILFRAVL